MQEEAEQTPASTLPSQRPFRTAVLRGLGGLLAPLLTIVILLWVWQTLKYYVLAPVTDTTRNVIAWQLADIRDDVPASAVPNERYADVFEIEGTDYQRLPTGKLIPRDVYQRTARSFGDDISSKSGIELYRRWVEVEYLRPWIVIPVFLIVFLTLMYLLGSLFAAGIGRVFWSLFEYTVGRVPIVRAVYGSVKQVTDYMFNESNIKISRVVAVEYPRRGVWTIAFVTGEGLADVQKLTGEPMLTLLFPTCPTPIAGNTKLVPRRETIDLRLSVDQAVQYILSFGVVIPEEQVKEGIGGRGAGVGEEGRM